MSAESSSDGVTDGSPQLKFCRGCGQYKARDQFYPNRVSGGVSPRCKQCQSLQNNARATPASKSKYNQAWRDRKTAADPRYFSNKSAAQLAELRRSDPHKLRAKRFVANLSGAGRAERDGTITVPAIVQLLRGAITCTCCGRLLKHKLPEIPGQKDPAAPSIDRVNNSLGYTLSNVAVICLLCNTRKRDLTIADIEMLGSYILRHTAGWEPM